MRTRTFLAGGVAAFLLVGSVGPSVGTAVEATTPETTGTMDLTASTTLAADHGGNIVIHTDGVTLDCAGHTIHGPGDPAISGGITIHDAKDVTVRGCIVSGFTPNNGLFAMSGSNIRLQGNTFVGNGNHGLHLNGVTDSVVVGNTAKDNGTVEPAIGIVLSGSSRVTVQQNVVSGQGRGMGIALLPGTTSSTVVGNGVTGTGWGIYLQGSSANVLARNTVNANERGFLVAGSSGNVLSANVANGNKLEGFRLDTGNPSNTLARNIANGNDTGFRILASNGNVLSWNSARSNRSYGIAIGSGSSGNTVAYCTAVGNGRYDAYRGGPGTGNVWYRNTFGTKAGL